MISLTVFQGYLKKIRILSAIENAPYVLEAEPYIAK
jgi:hypothetical protein